MISLLYDICFDLQIHILSYCNPIDVLIHVNLLSRHFYILCFQEDIIWQQFCKSYGFNAKLYKELSWFCNFKYVAIHYLSDNSVIKTIYKRKCCKAKESINFLLISGVNDDRERILQSIQQDYASINIRSQFSHHTGLTKTQFTFQNREFHGISFYFHLLLTFPTYFPSFPISDSYKDIILWIVDASRQNNPIHFSPQNQLADVLYNQRYYHYSRKCLHFLLSCIAPWVPLILVVINQDKENAMTNLEIIHQFKLWKEHRIWRIYSLQNKQQSIHTLYIHCINEINHIRYRLANFISIVFYKESNQYEKLN